MKKLFLIGMLLFALGIKAQVISTDTLGIKPDGSVLMGECVDFSAWIENMDVDSTGAFLIVRTRNLSKNEKSIKNKGAVSVISVPEKKVLWNKSINYLAQQPTYFFQTLSIFSKGKSTFLDLETGNELWKEKFVPYIRCSQANLLLGYKVSSMSGFTKKLEGRDASTGKLVWDREISHHYGWNDSFMLDDTLCMIVSDGLHIVNVNNGQGNSIQMKTGIDDYKVAAALGALGILTGVLGGVAVLPYGPNVVVEMVSNVVQEDSLYYVANHETLLCLDKDLKMKWGYPIPETAGYNSALFTLGDSLYMINMGSAYRDNLRGYSAAYADMNLKVKMGKPFVAGFNKKNGQNQCFDILSEKKEIIEDMLIEEDHNRALILFEDRAYRYTFGDETVKKMYQWDTEANGVLMGVMKRPFFVMNEDSISFQKCGQSDSTQFVFTDKEMFYEVDEHFNILRTIPMDDGGNLIVNWDNNPVVRYRRKTLLLDGTGHKMATLDVLPEFLVSGDKVLLLSSDRKKIFIAAWSDVVFCSWK